MTLVKDIRVVFEMGKVCEYFFRKGVLDAAIAIDPVEIRQCADRKDGFTTLRFLRDNFGKEMKPQAYIDYVEYVASLVGAHVYRDILYKMQSMKSLRNGMCYICDAFYRDGLIAGIGMSIPDARKYATNTSYSNTMICPDGKKISKYFWMDTIKYKAQSIYYEHKNLDFQGGGMLLLAEYLKDTMRRNENLRYHGRIRH